MIDTVRPLLAGVVSCLAVVGSAHAQESSPVPDRTEGLRVFLDCAATCDEDFLRREISVVSFVRDRQDADVHVLISSQATGAGGLEYTAQFIGLAKYSNVDHTLTFASPSTSTADERRTRLAELLKRGLVRYIADTPLADRLSITFLPEAAAEPDPPDAAKDPWNLWVFSTTFTGTFNGERSTSGRSLRLGVSANRTSDTWRISISSAGSYRDDSFQLGGEQTFRSVSKTVGLSALVVKSLTDHWSAGLVADSSSSTFLNYDLKARAAIGLEYNVFPYSESTRKMLTTQYTVGVNSFDYREETIFDQLSERLLDHRVGVLLTVLQPWGSAGAELSFSQFLSKPDKYNLSALGQTNVRLARGFAFNTFVTVSRTQDQLYLPKAGATPEEILVREQQLATSYRYSLVLGFTYTFGSIFNNIVNPRFGRTAEDPAVP